MPRKVISLAAAALALVATASLAQFQAGKSYTLMQPPQPTEGGGKIEVIEFFWYGCGHCYHLEEFIEKWSANLPKDVVFKRVPAIPNEGWGQLAGVFFTLEAMGLLDKYHRKVFDAIHQENVNFSNRKLRDEWLAKNGVDAAKFADVEKSFAVQTRLNRAKQMTASYRIDSVPMLVVNGKYVTSPQHVGSADKVMFMVDALIGMARKDKTALGAAKLELVQR